MGNISRIPSVLAMSALAASAVVTSAHAAIVIEDKPNPAAKSSVMGPNDKGAKGSVIDPNDKRARAGLIDPNEKGAKSGVIDPNEKKPKQTAH